LAKEGLERRAAAASTTGRTQAAVAAAKQAQPAQRIAAAWRWPGAILWVASLTLALSACASPSRRVEQRAADLGFRTITLPGTSFYHLAYEADGSSSSATLHVYVEHDGTPWFLNAVVSEDPTPRNPLALELMARDQGPRLFLGRPCYFELRHEPGCTPMLWTQRRYSAEVVESMSAALRSFLSTRSFRQVVLIGYSGGGTIAWLMAERLPETAAVVTVAANLDIDYWTSIHGYSPLAGSLNPALRAPLSSTIRQLHYVGSRDQNVPPSVVRSFALRHPEARVVELADFDHKCCWIEQWPQLLRGAERSASSLGGGYAVFD
jgi:dienelactone hydrolase